MPTDLLSELKKLQYQRSDSSPFASHVEFHTWADKVIPLLSYNPKLHNQFSNAVASSESSRILKIPQQEIQHINSAIGILNQAITLLEVNPIPSRAPNPSSDTSNNKVKFLSFPKGSALTRLAFEVFALVIGMVVLYIFRHHFGIPL